MNPQVSKIKRIAQGANVMPLLWALQQHPELWNQHTARTAPEDSPHHEVDDVWCRYAEMHNGSAPEIHDSVWYPGILEKLPVRPMVMDLMKFVQGERLGGVLITRIKAGCRVQPHMDPGWHARYYEKYAVQLQSAPGQFFSFEDQRLEAQPGDVYWFDNQFTHWVENDTPYDRITAIVAIKTHKGD